MSKMKRIVFAVTTVCIFAIGIVFYSSYFEFEYEIFAQIDELAILNDYIVGDGEDRHIGSMEYNRSFCHTIQYKGNEYLVCAYEFADPTSSKHYYKNVWNEEFNFWTDWWSRSKSSFSGCEYMTFDGNRVLYFKTNAPLHKATEFENWLAQSLTIELPDHNTPILPNEEQMENLQNMIKDIPLQ